MGATRLPGKMLMDIAGKPAIEQVIDHVRLSKLIHEIWLATTINPSDDQLATWAKEHGLLCYRGSEQDVLDRYYQTAKQTDADVVVRVTGDCPFIDYTVVDRVVAAFDPEKYDYVSNIHPPTYPDGLDTEVFSFVALEKAWKEAQLTSEREHVTPYIWKHTELFRQYNVVNDVDFSAERWTLDTPEDLAFLCKIGKACRERGGWCGMHEIFEILNAHPEWRAINAQYERNEGYAKSVKEDV